MNFALVFVYIITFGITGGGLGNKISYSGYKVYRFTPQNDEQRNVLLGLQVDNPGINFWKEVSQVGQAVDIMFPPHLQGDLLQGMVNSDIPNSEYIDNVQKLIDDESTSTFLPNEPRRLNWNSYGSLQDIYDFLDEQAGIHSDKAFIETIGKSFEGHDLKVFKISKPGNDDRKIIWIDANLHAREWISSAVCTWVINELLNSQVEEIVALTDEFDWHFMPMANPDGFQYTKTNDRMWRKTRSDTGSSLGCRGVDANKNFAFHWMEGGSSTNPCTETFAGNEAFSEPETDLMSQYYSRIAPRTVVYLTLHSYGQLILFPYGFSDARIPQYDEYMRIVKSASDALYLRFNTRFGFGNVVEQSIVQSGSSLDWVKGIHNTNLTLWYELRDTGSSGFVLPADQIIPSSQEFLDSLLEIVEQVRSGIAGSEQH